MFQAYIDEFYGPNAYDAEEWLNSLAENGVIINEYPGIGFIVYELKGDAVILYDLYVLPEARSTKKAWYMHDKLLELAKSVNKRVCISFSDTRGKTRTPGIGALTAAEFHKCYTIDDLDLYMKGI